MADNLVIVESPAKAKTIEKFLGKEFKVKSSFGHVRDLAKKDLGIDINNNYTPQYIVSDDKKKVVSELKKEVKDVDYIWLATDEDREGEAIAWHLYEVLKLKNEKVKRIVFHEITDNAIKNAVQNPRGIDFNLVNAQQARRILDRLVGFELSPILWKKIKPSLSAGRVQSVAVRLLVEREREILAFKPVSSFKVQASFIPPSSSNHFKAELNKRLKNKQETQAFLKDCKGAEFIIQDVVKKPSRKSPPAPFTTSTLQQEASRKFGFSVAQTMRIAQKLYEAGKITYMRTDSVNLSDMAIQGSKSYIQGQFGDKYLETRKYKTKSKGAQEAHEAIRPTYIENARIKGSNQEVKLYELIWKRTIASQMKDALFEKTTATINVSGRNENFIATGEILKFDGFLKVYMESDDEEQNKVSKDLLPPLSKGEKLKMEFIEATERFSNSPPRYNEASLVRKLEELGIGRPSTYAPIISTIQQRGYVVKEDRPGNERKYQYLILKENNIKEETKTENAGVEKAKLFPNNIGMVVNDFLVKNFESIMDFGFTANVEAIFDEIADGKVDWQSMIDNFYKEFHKKVEETLENSQRDKGERVLGNDPKTGKKLSVKIGRYGPVAQLGDVNDEEKPKFAPLLKGQLIETITYDEAMELFKLPREIGEYEEKKLVIGIGRFGPYVKHNNKFYSLKKDDDPQTIDKERAIQLIEEKRERDRNKYIKTFENHPELEILNGRWGPYISYQKKNYKIPKDTDPSKLSYEDCMKIIENKGKTKKNKKQ